MTTTTFTMLALLLLGSICSATSLKNTTLNRDIDIQLFRIENAVKTRNLPEFSMNFHEEFDSEAWFNRYYSQLTEAQLLTYTLRRFANVDPSPSSSSSSPSFTFKFSESRMNGPNMLHRSWVAKTKANPRNPYAIVELKQYGEYKKGLFE